MTLKRLIVLSLLALLSAKTAFAEPLRGENMLVPLPKGFKMGANSHPKGMLVVEYVPQDETVQNWSRMVTQQIVFGASRVDPDALPRSMSPGWASSCPGGSSQKILGAAERGYPVSIWMFLCPLNPATQRPESMWMKTISGADSFYSVQYAVKETASPELISPAMAYLRSVTVCDTRREAAKCPNVTEPESRALQ